MDQPILNNNIPKGFKPRHFGEGFIDTIGPLYTRLNDGKLQAGFLVEPRHTNPMGICHGGMLATFADMLCPISAHVHCEAAKGRFLPTISLQIDYMASAKLGAWVQGEAQVLRVTRTMIFMQGLISSGDITIARVSGIFKLGPEFKGAMDRRD